jgi:hypothetical protein
LSNLKHDILSGKALIKAGYRIFPDEDPEESGVFAVHNGKISKPQSFAFMPEHTSLLYLRTKPMTLQQFGKMTGYALWHRKIEKIGSLIQPKYKRHHSSFCWPAWSHVEEIRISCEMSIVHDRLKYS